MKEKLMKKGSEKKVMKKILCVAIVAMMVVAFIPTVTAVVDTIKPSVQFVDPTPSSGTQSDDYIHVNVSSSDENQHYAFVDFNYDLVLWMRMDDVNEENGNLIDLSSYGNDGIAEGDADQTTDGFYGKAFSFDGDGDNITFSTMPLISLEDSFTVSAWFKTTVASGTRAIYSERGPGVTNSLFFNIVANTGYLWAQYMSGGTSAFMYGDIDANDGEWHHVAFVKIASNDWRLYHNGNQIDSSSNEPNKLSGVDRVTIGDMESPGHNYFDGEIDEVLAFKRALDQTEIQALYNASTYQYEHNFTGLDDGAYNFTGYAVDRAGNKDETETRKVTIIDTVWIVTDGVVFPVAKDHHYFYDCFGDELWSNHTQEWYYQDGGYGSGAPIKGEGWWINTSMECWAESSGNHAILYTKTYGQNIDIEEYIDWIVYNGAAEAENGSFVVYVTWTDDQSSEQSDEVTVEIDGDTKKFGLGYLQDLSMDLRYWNGSRCPGHKYYWMAFNGEEPLDPEWQEPDPPKYNNYRSFPPINNQYPSQWWQNYSGDPEEISEIWEKGWHINLKVDFKMEEDATDAILYVKMYSQSNFWPEWCNWTIGGGNKSDNYFTVKVYDGEDNLLFDETATTEWQQKECGSLQNFTLDVTYTDPQ